MLNPFIKTQTSFGLDISGSSLKMMQLGQKGSEVTIRGYTDVAFPKGMIVNDAIVDSKTFTFLVKQALGQPLFGKIDNNRCVACLPESKSFVRVIQIPNMSESEAESAVPFEAESFIPLPIDQVYLDWQKLSDADDKMNILIIASPKEYVDRYLEILDQAGLTVTALEVESQSCCRALLGNESKETALVVDLDAYRSSLVMVDEGRLQFTSTIPIAGNSFSESIAKTLGVSSAKAEEIKKQVGIANTANYPNIKISMVPVLNNLSAEIKNVLKFHNEHEGKPVGRLILSGGSAKLANLPEFLAMQFADVPGLKIELGKPWLQVRGLKQSVISDFDSLSYATAIGLAMRGIGL